MTILAYNRPPASISERYVAIETKLRRLGARQALRGGRGHRHDEGKHQGVRWNALVLVHGRRKA